MALTELKLKDLKAKELDNLYIEREADWIGLEQTARTHAQQSITGGEEPRPDDVAQVLTPMLEVYDPLREYFSENKIRGKRWVEWFAEYIVDQRLGET